MLTLASADYAIAHLVGEITAIVALSVLALGLGWRALDLRGRRVASAASLPPLPPALAAAPDDASVSPPGWVAPAHPAPIPASPARVGRTRRARRTDAAAALVFGVLLVVALGRFVDHHTAGPWDTQQAREMHAGFMDGCQRSASAIVDCGCAWQHLTSAPPYDTPAGLVTLEGPIVTAMRERSVRALPPQYIAALQSCRVGRSG